MSSHVRARRRRQLPDAGGYLSLFSTLSTPPLVLVRSFFPSLLRLPCVFLKRLIYYSRSGCFINCLSLRIKPTARRGWVDGTRRRALISSAAALFSLFLYLLECSLAYPYIRTSSSLAPFNRSRSSRSTRDAISARYVCSSSAWSYYLADR